MTTYYVNKSGNDGNSGLSHNDAFLTVGFAISAAITSDTIVIGTGVYAESLTSTATTLTFTADGHVIFDGEGSTNDFIVVNTTSGDWTFNGYFKIHNYVRSAIYNNINNGSFTLRLNECIIIGDGKTGAFAAFHNYNTEGPRPDTLAIYLDKCIISSMLYGFWLRSFSDAAWWMDCYVQRTIFYNIDTVYRLIQTYQTNHNEIWRDKGNIYHSCDTIYYSVKNLSDTFVGLDTEYGDNYYHNYNSPLCTALDASPADLTALQALTGKYGGDSAEADPLLADPSNNIFYYQANSPVIGKGKLIDYIGPYQSPLAFCNDYQYQGNWTVGDTLATDAGTQWIYISGTGITKSGENFVGVGTLVSPVIDLGYKRNVTKLSHVVSETYPTEVIDKDNTDSEPNKRNIEYKISDSSFNQDDSSLSWNTIEIEEDLSGAVGRYIQIKLTFRDDGVAA